MPEVDFEVNYPAEVIFNEAGAKACMHYELSLWFVRPSCLDSAIDEAAFAQNQKALTANGPAFIVALTGKQTAVAMQ